MIIVLLVLSSVSHALKCRRPARIFVMDCKQNSCKTKLLYDEYFHHANTSCSRGVELSSAEKYEFTIEREDGLVLDGLMVMKMTPPSKHATWDFQEALSRILNTEKIDRHGKIEADEEVENYIHRTGNHLSSLRDHGATLEDIQADYAEVLVPKEEGQKRYREEHGIDGKSMHKRKKAKALQKSQ